MNCLDQYPKGTFRVTNFHWKFGTMDLNFQGHISQCQTASVSCCACRPLHVCWKLLDFCNPILLTLQGDDWANFGDFEVRKNWILVRSPRWRLCLYRDWSNGLEITWSYERKTLSHAHTHTQGATPPPQKPTSTPQASPGPQQHQQRPVGTVAPPPPTSEPIMCLCMRDTGLMWLVTYFHDGIFNYI